MQWVKHHVTGVVGTGMIRDHFGGAANDNTGHEALDSDLTVTISDGHRVIIAAVTHHGCRCDLTALQIAGLKGRPRQFPHCSQVGVQPCADAGLVCVFRVMPGSDFI